MPHYPDVTIPRRLEAITAGIGYDVASPYTVSIGLIPANAVVIGCLVNTATAFSQASLTVGSNPADYDNLVGASDLTETSAGATTVLKYVALAADTTYKAKFVDAGTSTQGYAYITILYSL